MSDWADIDMDREGRTNLPEVVFANGKSMESLFISIDKVLESGKALVTKCTDEQLAALEERYKDLEMVSSKEAKAVAIHARPGTETGWKLVVMAAGSSDIPVAEEAAFTAEFLGMEVRRFYDCGVAGLHRIKAPIDELNRGETDIVIVIAGMEGTLPSVVSGLVKQPVVAVPTSVGYGTGAGGISALLTMLNSCSPGITVMNIDNGFGAAAFAYKTLKWLKG